MKLLQELSQLRLAETSELNDVTIDDMKDKRELFVGDPVIITGNVNFKGETGDISSFGTDKKFVVVNLYNHGRHSFHSSDVSYNDYADEGGDEDDGDEEQTKFWVAVYDEDENATGIGMVSMEGGKWRERHHKGTLPYNWGGTYMGYLSPDQVMQWIHKDYSSGMEIEGPFDSAQEAEEYAEHNFGPLKEAGAFSYGAKAPRKGSVAYMAAAKRKADDSKPERVKQIDAIAAKNTHYGNAKVTKEATDSSINDDDYYVVDLTTKKPVKRYGTGFHNEKMAMADAEKRGDNFKVMTGMRYKTRFSVNEMATPFRLKSKVKIVSGPKDVVGKEGMIGEIRKDIAGNKTFTIDYDYDESTGKFKSVQLKAKNLTNVKDTK